MKRHALANRHKENCKESRDISGSLQEHEAVRTCLDFYTKVGMPESDKLVVAETIFVLGLKVNGIPISWADIATSVFPKMLTDSCIGVSFRA